MFHRPWVTYRALTLLIGLALTGCGSTPDASPTPPPTDLPAPTAVAALPTVTPTTVAAPDAAAAPSATVAADMPTAAPTVAPTFDPATVTLALRPVAIGLDQPLFATHAGDGSGRLFVLEKPGRIRIVADGQPAAAPFLDLTDRVRSAGSEQGLLGLAFPPDYATTGYFFVDYTDVTGATVVARFHATTPDQADPNSEFVVLTFPQPAPNHNGGMVAFGPDGYLWIGTGDGGASGDRFGNGQNPATLLGKLLRLDVTSDPSVPYVIPADNPWVAADWNGLDVIDEVWALGLRNPWRFSFDRATDDLWIGDVGQNQYEEVDFVPAGSPGGLNFGWPILEATHCYESASCDATGTVLPVLEYTHAGNCSITGGYVYRGSQFPVLNGVYFYSDYCSGTIWAATPDGNGGWASTAMLQSGLLVASFGEDEAGELYVIDLGGGVSQLTAE